MKRCVGIGKEGLQNSTLILCISGFKSIFHEASYSVARGEGTVEKIPGVLHFSAALFPLRLGFQMKIHFNKGFYGLKKRLKIVALVVGES